MQPNYDIISTKQYLRFFLMNESIALTIKATGVIKAYLAFYVMCPKELLQIENMKIVSQTKVKKQCYV